MTSGFLKLVQVFFIWVRIKYGYYKSIVKLKLSKIKHTKNMFFSKTFMFFEHQVCFILSKLNEMIDPGIEREESVQINIKDRICPNNRNGMLTHKHEYDALSRNRICIQAAYPRWRFCFQQSGPGECRPQNRMYGGCHMRKPLSEYKVQKQNRKERLTKQFKKAGWEIDTHYDLTEYLVLRHPGQSGYLYIGKNKNSFRIGISLVRSIAVPVEEALSNAKKGKKLRIDYMQLKQFMLETSRRLGNTNWLWV